MQVELTGSGVFDYIHPGDHVEMAEQLGMKLPPGRGVSLSQGAVHEDGASSASSSSHSETPEPGKSAVFRPSFLLWTFRSFTVPLVPVQNFHVAPPHPPPPLSLSW